MESEGPPTSSQVGRRPNVREVVHVDDVDDRAHHATTVLQNTNNVILCLFLL